MIDTYNEQVFKWERRADRDANVDDFVVHDEKKIKWTDRLKQDLKRGETLDFSQEKVRTALYRPFMQNRTFILTA